MIISEIHYRNYGLFTQNNLKAQRTNKNITFEGIKSIPVKEVKNLHALICPRCGGPIIEPQKLTEAYRVISLPLKQMLKNGYMDRNKNVTEIWTLLNEFAEKYPKLSLDKILEQEENHTLFRTTIEKIIVPDLDRNNRELYNENIKKFNGIEDGIRKSARTKLRSSAVVMTRLKSFLPYLKEIEKTDPFKTEIRGKIGAFEELLYYSSVYPDKTLSEIINMPEVRSYIEKMIEGTQEEFKHQYTIKFTDVRKIVQNSTECSEEEINKFQSRLMAILFKSDKDPGVRRHNALKFCQTFVKEKHCQNIYPKIYDLIKEMPEPPYNKYVELSNAFDKNNDYMIVDSLLKQYLGTNEHFIARSTGGDDSRANKISMHRGCNRKRSNTPYGEYINIYPRIPYYMAKQVEQVSNYILEDKMISKYKLYPPLIAKTINEATDGKVNIDVTRYCRKALQKTKDNMKQQEQTIASAAEKRDYEIAHLSRLKEEEKNIQQTIEAVNTEHRQAIEAQKEERRIHGWLNKYLEDKT